MEMGLWTEQKVMWWKTLQRENKVRWWYQNSETRYQTEGSMEGRKEDCKQGDKESGGRVVCGTSVWRHTKRYCVCTLFNQYKTIWHNMTRHNMSSTAQHSTFNVLSIPPLAAHRNVPLLNPTHSTDIVPSSSSLYSNAFNQGKKNIISAYEDMYS